MDDLDYMREALALAGEAAAAGETPVGCVVVGPDGGIIGRGRNRTEERDATCHAETEAIRDASRAVGGWRLSGCTLYVTMEPCPMCAGAVMSARISRVVFGARDRRAGALGGVLNIFMEGFGFSPEVRGGVLEDECRGVLTAFFSGRR